MKIFTVLLLFLVFPARGQVDDHKDCPPATEEKRDDKEKSRSAIFNIADSSRLPKVDWNYSRDFLLANKDERLWQCIDATTLRFTRRYHFLRPTATNVFNYKREKIKTDSINDSISVYVSRYGLAFFDIETGYFIGDIFIYESKIDEPFARFTGGKTKILVYAGEKSATMVRREAHRALWRGKFSSRRIDKIFRLYLVQAL